MLIKQVTDVQLDARKKYFQMSIYFTFRYLSWIVISIKSHDISDFDLFIFPLPHNIPPSSIPSKATLFLVKLSME